MEELVTKKGLELSPPDIDDIVSCRAKDGSDKWDTRLFKIVAVNATSVVAELLPTDTILKEGHKEILPLSRYRFFEASDLWKAMSDEA